MIFLGVHVSGIALRVKKRFILKARFFII